MDEVSIGNAASHVCDIGCAGLSDRRTEAGVRPADSVRRLADDQDLYPAGVRSPVRSEAADANARCAAGHVGRVRRRTADAADQYRPLTEAAAVASLRRIDLEKDDHVAPLGDLVPQPEGLAADAYPAGGGHG